jgi:hypothetical protein
VASPIAPGRNTTGLCFGSASYAQTSNFTRITDLHKGKLSMKQMKDAETRAIARVHNAMVNHQPREIIAREMTSLKAMRTRIARMEGA